MHLSYVFMKFSYPILSDSWGLEFKIYYKTNTEVKILHAIYFNFFLMGSIYKDMDLYLNRFENHLLRCFFNTYFFSYRQFGFKRKEVISQRHVSRISKYRFEFLNKRELFGFMIKNRRSQSYILAIQCKLMKREIKHSRKVSFFPSREPDPSFLSIFFCFFSMYSMCKVYLIIVEWFWRIR